MYPEDVDREEKCFMISHICGTYETKQMNKPKKETDS